MHHQRCQWISLLVALYAHQLRHVASETLGEEAVMVAVEQTYHVV